MLRRRGVASRGRGGRRHIVRARALSARAVARHAFDSEHGPRAAPPRMFWLTAAERDALWGGVRAFCPSTPSWRIGAMLDLLIADHDAAPVGIPRQYATTLRMPGLPSAGWFDAADFAWMPAVTRAFSAICDDLDRIADEPERFQSYVGEDAQGQADALAAGWRSYFFCRDGRWHDGAARRCPAVLALIDAVPWFPGDLMFSALAPGTEIPFHYGLDNLHLTLHLP
ncbi:MAG: aspartyl/asparaginyl beta-hydroxylase domain-containing protein, partial [Sphingomonas sp.]